MFPSVSGYFVNRPEQCVDASHGLKWVIRGEPWRKKARRFLCESIAAGIVLIAPPLFEYDRIIAATAKIYGGKIISKDEQLRNTDAIEVIW